VKTTDERAPGLANGESNTAPAGGVVASVADAAPAGSSALAGSATVAYVTTTSPCSVYAVVAVIVVSAACTNWSAAVTPAGVPGAHAAPAAPSGHDGWTIVCSTGGVPPTVARCSTSAASSANALALSDVQALSSVPFGISWPVMYGAAGAFAVASLNENPDSSISHTFVIGGSFDAVVVDLLGAGELVSGSAAGSLGALAAAGALVAVGVAAGLVAAGVACGAIVGGGVAAVAAGACVWARAASDAISAGSCWTTSPLPASDGRRRRADRRTDADAECEHRDGERGARAKRRQPRAPAMGRDQRGRLVVRGSLRVVRRCVARRCVACVGRRRALRVARSIVWRRRGVVHVLVNRPQLRGDA